MKQNNKTRDEINKEIKSKHIIINSTGTEISIDLSDKSDLENKLTQLDNESLKSYIFSEEIKGSGGIPPPSIVAMKKLQLVDYADSSDSGHFNLFPAGKLIFELLSDWSRQIAIDHLNCLEIDTPVLYDWNDPEIRSQGESFHERHYTVLHGKEFSEGNKEFVLRFAGDFGLFKLIKKAPLTYRNLPLRIYEFSKSFRLEKSGELCGLKRLRAFHMPDIHSFTENIESGFNEYEQLHMKYTELAEGTGVEYALVFRIVNEFYEQNKKRIKNMIIKSKRPAFVELLSDMKHYWVMKHEFQNIDSVKSNMQLSTVQLDIKDSELYGITYVGNDGMKKGCIICHSSVGSIERWMYAILEESLKKEKPVLPLWLYPIQVRLIPVSGNSEDQLNYSKNIAKIFQNNNIRSDIDDRNETLSKKIRFSQQNWIPYTIIIGNNEVQSSNLSVNNRYTGGKNVMDLDKLLVELKSNTVGKPYHPRQGSMYLSKFVSFI